MSTPMTRRATAVLVCACALLVAALAVASETQAATLYACVKKNGTTRVFVKKPKCKKGESKLNWGSSGPAGKNGANGSTGANGSNGKDGTNGKEGAGGAVAGFAAAQTGEVNITKATSPTTILSKSIPAGAFIAAGKVQITAIDTSSEAHAGVGCELVDTPTGGALSVLDEGNWMQSVDVPVFLVGDFAQGVISFNAGLTAGASTLAIRCEETDNDEGKGKLSIIATEAKITAVQATSVS